jgi:hypothetical protein
LGGIHRSVWTSAMDRVSESHAAKQWWDKQKPDSDLHCQLLSDTSLPAGRV